MNTSVFGAFLFPYFILYYDYFFAFVSHTCCVAWLQTISCMKLEPMCNVLPTPLRSQQIMKGDRWQFNRTMVIGRMPLLSAWILSKIISSLIFSLQSSIWASSHSPCNERKAPKFMERRMDFFLSPWEVPDLRGMV